MLFSVLRYLIWMASLLVILSVLSFVILLRDPLNADLVTQNSFSGYVN